MPQSLAKLPVHIVFSTKSRRPLIRDDIRDELHAYMTTVMWACESPSITIGSRPDHAHILCVLSKTSPLSKVIEMVKKRSSKWIKTKGAPYRTFQWQSGYAAFSVSPSNVAAVRKYIESQGIRHRRLSFEEELRHLLEKHGVDFDERYVWD